jgi:multidrug transporter EmrE-like cation transporter
MQWLFLLVASLCNIAGILILKRSAAPDLATSTLGLSWPLVCGIGLFVVNLIFYVKALRDIPVALAYPVSIGLSAPGVSLGALFWFGERVTPLHLLGTALVVGGIFLLSLQRGPA